MSHWFGGTHVALDAFSGKQNWIKNIPGSFSIFSKDGKLAYMYSDDGVTTTSSYSATSILTGETVWGMSGGADGFMALAPSIDGKALFALNYNRVQHAGSVLWSVDPTTGKNQTLGHVPVNFQSLDDVSRDVSLDAHGEAIYVVYSRDATWSRVSALSTRDASLLWSSDCKPPSRSSPKILVV